MVAKLKLCVVLIYLCDVTIIRDGFVYKFSVSVLFNVFVVSDMKEPENFELL